MQKNKCSIWWCNNPNYALGLCKPHWAGLKRYGHPYGKHREQMERIESIIKLARYVAVGVTEFAKTEFEPTEFGKQNDSWSHPVVSWNTHDILDDTKTCPFCNGKNGEHSQECIVKLSELILDATNRRIGYG